jgi:hypothetical protein
VTSSFLIQEDLGAQLIGCGFNIPAKLESINMSLADIDMILLLNSDLEQIGGLPEVADFSKRSGTKKFLVAPESVLENVRKYSSDFLDLDLDHCFDAKSCHRVVITEEHHSEEIKFIDNYHGKDGHALLLESSKIFISGKMLPNEDFLHRYGAPSDLVFHSCVLSDSHGDELGSLPLYIQQKIWLYDYSNSCSEIAQPFPMLFLPQGTCVLDTARKDKLLSKERFIRESSRRQLGNVST